MDNRKKMRRVSKGIYIFLMILGVSLAGFSLDEVVAVYSGDIFIDAFSSSKFNFIISLMFWLQLGVFGAILIIIALTFRTISRNETPFVRSVPRNMKIVAIMLTATVELPKWLAQAFRSAENTLRGVTIFDEVGIMALIISLVLYGFALIFDYGRKIQDENYEIL